MTRPNGIPVSCFPEWAFVVTTLTVPVERVFEFYNRRGTAVQYTKEGQIRTQMDTVVLQELKGQRGSAPTSCIGLQSGELSCAHWSCQHPLPTGH